MINNFIIVAIIAYIIVWYLVLRASLTEYFFNENNKFRMASRDMKTRDIWIALFWPFKAIFCFCLMILYLIHEYIITLLFLAIGSLSKYKCLLQN